MSASCIGLLDWVASHLCEPQRLFIFPSVSAQEFDSLGADQLTSMWLFCEMMFTVINLIHICLSCISDLLVKEFFFIFSLICNFMAPVVMVDSCSFSVISLSKPLVVSGTPSAGVASASGEFCLCCGHSWISLALLKLTCLSNLVFT